MTDGRREDFITILLVGWAAVGIFTGIVYTNRNWNAANVETWPKAPSFETGQGPPGTTEVYVDQGPLWLVRLLYEPPWWAEPVLLGVLAIVLAVAAYKVWTIGIEPEALVEVVNRAVLLSLVAGSVILLKATGLFPYVLDVLGGTIIGLVLAWTIRKRVDWEDILLEGGA